MSYRRRFRNLVLNRSYQLRYTLAMVVLSSLLTTGLGLVWYHQVQVSNSIMEVKALSSLDEEDVRQIRADVAAQDRVRVLMLVAFGVVVAVAVAGYGIVLTHKAAGPLLIVNRHMLDIARGHLGTTRALRRGDQLGDFYETFRAMHAALRREAEADAEVLDRAIVAVRRLLDEGGTDAARDLVDRLRLLEDMRARKRAKVAA